MTHRPSDDATGKNADQRFVEIRKFFLDSLLTVYGNARKELYYRPKPGDAREPTEEELVRRWAYRLDVSVNDIRIGINRAIVLAAGAGRAVTNFRECVPHIEKRMEDLRDSRAAEGWR